MRLSQSHPFRSLSRALLVATGMTLAVPVQAGAPPDHAPAHGWRRQNDPYYLGYNGRQWPRDYGIIEGRCDRAAIGTVLGGVIGGAIGSQVGDGSGRVVATILGTFIGAVIGREIGKDMDEADRACVGHALEIAREGQRVRWTNERTGMTYVVTPHAVRSDSSCRTFSLEVSADGRAQSRDSAACRTGDGTWQLRNR